MRFAAFLLSVAVAGAAPAQSSPSTDSGSFTLFVNGQPVGRELFWVRRDLLGSTPILQVKARLTTGTRRIESTLRTDTTGLPVEYLTEEFAGTERVSRVSGVLEGNRLTVRRVSPGRQSSREFRLTPGTVLLDTALVHQYYFMALVTPGSRVPVMHPRRAERDTVTVSVRSASQEVEVGNGTLPARHLIVTDNAGIATDVWVDSKGRLLRLAVPSRGFVARRDDPPT